jgi:hypothetical protein
VFKTEGEARVFAQALPNATVQQIFGTWTVLEGDRSYSRNSNLRLTPADIVTDLGLRTTIEGLSARGMTAEQIWTTIDGLDVAPRLDAETGRQFVDSARVDLRVPSRNKPEELARWAKAKGYDTAPLDDPAAFRASIDSAIAQELAKRNPNRSLVTASSSSEKASVGGTTTTAATPAVTFTTSRGSEYVVDGNRTTRNKAPGIQYDAGDHGSKPASDQTVYVDKELADKLAGWVYTNVKGKMRLENGRLVVDAGGRRVVQTSAFKTAPEVGLHPVELWNSGNVHIGTPITEVRNATPDKTLGAATPTDTSQPGVQPTTEPTDLDLSELTRLQQTTPKAAYSAKTNVGGVDIGLMRFDMVGMVGGSEIPEFRAAARGIGLDWLVDEAGSPITYSAAEWVVDRHKAALADAYLPADRAFYEHRKGGGKMTRDEFDTAIGRALRRPTDPQADPHVASAAKAYRDVLNAIHERAVRHGVDIGYTPDYVPRRWSPEAIDAASAEIGAALMPTRDKATQFAAGREAVTKLLAESIEKAMVKIFEDILAGVVVDVF